MWDVLFTGAFRLDPCDTVSILETMVHVLPCVHCRRSYAHYVDRNPPATCGASEESISKWLWSVHDLVNLKLNKREACIPFSVVQTRHAVFTAWCSPFDPIDLLGIIALQVETTPQAEAYARLAPLFQKISVLCGAPRVSVAEHPSTTPSELWRHAFTLSNATRKALGFPVHTQADFLAQYELCRAHDDPASTRPPTTSGTTLRQLKSARMRGIV